MLPFAVDEDFDHDIVRGVRRRLSGADIFTIQEAGLRGLSDPAVLEWATGLGRVLLTHDLKTMQGFAYARIAAGHPVAGVLLVPQSLAAHEAIWRIAEIAAVAAPEAWIDRVAYLTAIVP